MTTTANIQGQLLTPGDAGYDAARTVWNAMIDRRPRMIVRAASVADVVTAVRLARDLDLEIGVRCGGHNVAGFAVPDDGLMIDLTPMGGVRVDPVAGAPTCRAARCSARSTARPSRTAWPPPPATSRTRASAA
jgi:FAD/FMN-containing dehydrogenase